MSEDNERRERLRTALRAAGEALGVLSDEEREGASGGAELLEHVVAYAQMVVEQTDPNLITDKAVSAIETEADGIATDASSAIASARSYADDLLEPVATLPAARDRDVEQSVKEAAANFQRSATHRLNALEAEVEAKRAAIEEELANLRTAVDETTATTRSDIESQGVAFAAKLTEFEATLTNQRQAISQALERQSETFSESQEERSKGFQAEIAEAKASLASLVTEAQDEVESRVAEIRRMEKESSGLVHSIGLAERLRGTGMRQGIRRRSRTSIAG